jgi:TolA-binding protein
MNNLLFLIIIFIFGFLFLYNILTPSLYEGMDNSDNSYSDYSDDPMILAQQNAGNIKSLKDQLDTISKSLEEIEPKQDSMQQQIDTNTNSIQSLIQGQQDQANDASGMDSDNPPTDISGLD